LGSNLRVQPDHVQTFLQHIVADPDIPIEAERAQAHVQVKDEYLAVMFLVNSNRQCYGSLVRDIKNEYTQGLNAMDHLSETSRMSTPKDWIHILLH
jgi:hypothetical protein